MPHIPYDGGAHCPRPPHLHPPKDRPRSYPAVDPRHDRHHHHHPDEVPQRHHSERRRTHCAARDEEHRSLEVDRAEAETRRNTRRLNDAARTYNALLGRVAVNAAIGEPLAVLYDVNTNRALPLPYTVGRLRNLDERACYEILRGLGERHPERKYGPVNLREMQAEIGLMCGVRWWEYPFGD